MVPDAPPATPLHSSSPPPLLHALGLALLPSPPLPPSYSPLPCLASPRAHRPPRAMPSIAVMAAMAASASLAPMPASASFSGLRSVRLPHYACPLRMRLPSRPARCLPTVLVRASASDSTASTFTTIQKIIAEQLAVGQDKILPESKFTELGADSLDTVEIMMALEEEFEIQLEQEAGEKIQTVAHAVELIDSVKALKGK